MSATLGHRSIKNKSEKQKKKGTDVQRADEKKKECFNYDNASHFAKDYQNPRKEEEVSSKGNSKVFPRPVADCWVQGHQCVAFFDTGACSSFLPWSMFSPSSNTTREP